MIVARVRVRARFDGSHCQTRVGRVFVKSRFGVAGSSKLFKRRERKGYKGTQRARRGSLAAKSTKVPVGKFSAHDLQNILVDDRGFPQHDDIDPTIGSAAGFGVVAGNRMELGIAGS